MSLCPPPSSSHPRPSKLAHSLHAARVALYWSGQPRPCMTAFTTLTDLCAIGWAVFHCAFVHIIAQQVFAGVDIWCANRERPVRPIIHKGSGQGLVLVHPWSHETGAETSKLLLPGSSKSKGTRMPCRTPMWGNGHFIIVFDWHHVAVFLCLTKSVN